MVKFYVTKIKNKRTTFERVPLRYREEVEKMLIQEGIEY